MVEETNIPVPAGTDFSTMAEAELQSWMTSAVANSDWKTVKLIANAMGKAEANAEKAKKEALSLVLVELTDKVKSAIGKAVQKLVDTGELDSADGVWYSWDFGDTLSTCRLTKKQTRSSGAGSGGNGNGVGKKYDASTKELLEQFGAEIDEKSGKTYQELADEAEGAEDKKNATYRVRVKLLKKAGLVS